MRVLVFLLACTLVACKSENKKPLQADTLKDIAAPTLINNPSEENSQLPRLFSTGTELYMSWVHEIDTVDHLRYAVFKDNQWSESKEIISGLDWFTNWADFPAIAENNGNILTSFLQKSADGTYTYDVKLNLYNGAVDSESKGIWNKNFILHNDGTQTEHGFVSMLPYEESQFFVTWLDGRNTVGGHEGHDGHGAGAMTLRAAFIDVTGEISSRTELDNRICDCCQTSAAMTPNGPVVAYRDRSDEEIRDISVVRMENGSWTAPMTVGDDQWKIPGCPVNGPSIDALGNNLAVAWFTMANEVAKVQVAFSDDGGVIFGKAIRIDNGNAIGRVDIIMDDENHAIVCWMEPKGDDTLIQLMRVGKDGSLGNLTTISKTSSERASGFPQIEKLNGTVYAAWTMIDGEKSQIETATISIENL